MRGWSKGHSRTLAATRKPRDTSPTAVCDQSSSLPPHGEPNKFETKQILRCRVVPPRVSDAPIIPNSPLLWILAAYLRFGEDRVSFRRKTPASRRQKCRPISSRQLLNRERNEISHQFIIRADRWGRPTLTGKERARVDDYHAALETASQPNQRFSPN